MEISSRFRSLPELSALFATAILLLPAGLSVAAEESLKGRSADQGQQPWVVDIEDLTLGNKNFRAAKWTGKHMQMTVMAIPPGEEIGFEVHDIGDQPLKAYVLYGPPEHPAGTLHRTPEESQEDHGH